MPEKTHGNCGEWIPAPEMGTKETRENARMGVCGQFLDRIALGRNSQGCPNWLDPAEIDNA